MPNPNQPLPPLPTYFPRYEGTNEFKSAQQKILKVLLEKVFTDEQTTAELTRGIVPYCTALQQKHVSFELFREKKENPWELNPCIEVAGRATYKRPIECEYITFQNIDVRNHLTNYEVHVVLKAVFARVSDAMNTQKKLAQHRADHMTMKQLKKDRQFYQALYAAFLELLT